MAKQAGPIYPTGTIDDITFYKMEGEYLARKKSSLDRKQFRTDPRFARSRKSAAAFGEASKLASDIYWQLPKSQRGKGVVNQLTRQVGNLMREGKSMAEIKEILLTHRQELTAIPKATEATPSASETTPVWPQQAPAIKNTKRAITKQAPPVKQARYLSRWKVKRNGRLHIPKHQTAACLPTAILHACHPALDPKPVEGSIRFCTQRQPST
jgi:hypothetical protein